jgi:hypothetical protein
MQPHQEIRRRSDFDVPIPTTDGRELQLIRYTRPSPSWRCSSNASGSKLPDQPPPIACSG